MHVQAVAFYAESGQLDLRRNSPAYATQLRLISSWIVAAANDAIGTQTVRTVRVLAVGATAPAPREVVTAPTAAGAPEAPVETRDVASPGFYRALTAHQAVPRVPHVSSGVTEAIERRRAMRELSRRAFLEPDVAPDDAPASMGDARLQRRRQAAATETAALCRARQSAGHGCQGRRPASRSRLSYGPRPQPTDRSVPPVTGGRRGVALRVHVWYTVRRVAHRKGSRAVRDRAGRPLPADRASRCGRVRAGLESLRSEGRPAGGGQGPHR
ncbi:hypothetical protein ABZ791_36365 [Streptomyces huasconensis]|uniref:Uncharacterized protein n=1 Tax=Streptomyces huasconensis TaxID=1854574 RepID=A0ABV3M4L0_9ACTN